MTRNRADDRPARARIAGAVALAVVAVVEVLSRMPFYGPEAYSFAVVLLLGAVVYSAFRGGNRAGLASSAIVVLYNAYFVSIPGQPFHYTDRGWRRMVLLGVVLPALAVLIGRMRESIERLLARERALREQAEALAVEAEEAAAEAEAAREQAEAATDEARQVASRTAFLADVSHVLASSLEYEETLRQVARLAVPRLADYCVIDLLEEDGQIRRVASAHANPAKEQLLRRSERFPPKAGSERWMRVLRTGEPELVRQVDAPWIAAVSQGGEHRHVIEALGPRSIIAVPLVARGHRLGVITLAAAASGRLYDAGDLALAEELGRRAAMAVDNARLYGAAVVANQAKSDFLAVMSHELRTPLTAIIGYTDLLDLEVAGPLNAGQKQQLSRVTASARHLLQLIEEVLSFSRLEAGREQVARERVDLAAFLSDVCHQVEPLALEKGLRIHTRVADRALTIETDPVKLRQILFNLLSNAVKFTAEGEIELRAEAEAERVLVRVRDTGMGVPPEFADKIFDPFWQVEEARTRQRGGTGLGLSVSRGLARLLGGDITVESQPGHGSTFTVSLPR